jgi:ATP-dependent Clp protease ATP-binding subunit ClpA
LSSFQAKPKDGKPLSGMNNYEIENVLAELAGEICTIVKSWGPVDDSAERNFLSPPPRNISISRMPVTDAAVFGREKETAMVDEAWNRGETNVVALIAWGGVGKTALVNHWLNDMSKDRFRGARCTHGPFTARARPLRE